VKAESFQAKGYIFFNTTENTMDRHATEATGIHRCGAQSLTFRRGLLWIVIALLALAVIMCLLLSSLSFVDTAFDLTFSYP